MKAQRAETEAADCVMVAHYPRFRLLVVAAGFDQGRYEHVIRYRLVDEAAAASVDTDITGLAAVKEMRERDDGSIRLRHQRHWRPRCWLVHLAMKCASDRLG